MSIPLPFGISSKGTYASLSPADLECLGKEAASAYLCEGVPLNDSVVKIARQHPSISPHQVQRVIEYANQDTFAQLFEKQSGDKNIEFQVADPSPIFHELNNGATPVTMSPPPMDYGRSPVKLAYSDVEADYQLARMFGVEPISPHALKTASAADRITSAYEDSALEDPGTALSADQVPMDAREYIYDEEAQKEGQAPMMGPMGPMMGGPVDAPIGPEQMAMMEQAHGQSGGQQQPPPQASPDSTHHDRMMGIQRDIEFAKKQQELQAIQQKMTQEMVPPGPAVPPGMEQGPPPGAAPAGPPMAGGPPPPAEAAPPPEAGGAPMGPPPEQVPPPFAGPMAAPPGSELPKMSSALTKEAMLYAKAGRPHSDLVLQDLREATSLDRIKQATARGPSYPEANRYGDLIRLREKLASLANEAKDARERNVFLTKEAQGIWLHEVTQHMFNGGNLGEVLHSLNSVRTGDVFEHEIVKQAAAILVSHLLTKGLDPVRAEVDTIKYEMEKGASLRISNPNNPIVQSFATLHKLASNQRVLDNAYIGLHNKYNEASQLLSKVMRHASAR